MLLTAMSVYSEIWEGEEEKKSLFYNFTSNFIKRLPAATQNIICLLRIFFCYYEKLVGEKYYVCAYGCVFVHLQLIYDTIFRLV